MWYLLVIFVVLFIVFPVLLFLMRYSWFQNYGLVLVILIGIAFTIYSVFLIPNENFQTIVTTILAAVFGGLLTLVGSAWTIKYGDKQKHDYELAKAKPLFTFNYFTEINPTVHNRKICIVKNNSVPNTVSEAIKLPQGSVSYMEIENPAQSSFIIKRFYFDGEWNNAYANNVLGPNNHLIVQLNRVDEVEHPIMETEDIFQRKFYYELIFEFYYESNGARQYTLAQYEEISKEEMVRRNIKI